MNLKELSRLLGLSQTTVSRALNGYPEVNAETRERVLKAVRETGYRPNRAAQRLATGRAGSIGLIMPTAADHQSDIHFAEFLTGLGDAALRSDHHLVVMPAAPQDEAGALRRLAASGNVDAIMLAYMRPEDERLDMMASLKLPFVVHGRSLGATEDYPYLDIDNEGAFQDAARLLLQLGHRRIGLINGPAFYAFAIRRRMGLEKALGEWGLTLDPDLTHHSAMTDDNGLAAMERFLSHPEPPTAVLCASTVLALGAVRAVAMAGLKVGEDISLIAHDDVLPVLRPENFSVPLTTTRSPIRAAGMRIGERLVNRTRAGPAEGQESPPEQELWKAELIVRASTCPPA